MQKSEGIVCNSWRGSLVSGVGSFSLNEKEKERLVQCLEVRARKEPVEEGVPGLGDEGEG